MPVSSPLCQAPQLRHCRASIVHGASGVARNQHLIPSPSGSSQRQDAHLEACRKGSTPLPAARAFNPEGSASQLHPLRGAKCAVSSGANLSTHCRTSPSPLLAYLRCQSNIVLLSSMKGEKQNKTKKTAKAKLKSLRTFLQPIIHPSVGPPAAQKVWSIDV